MKLVCCCTMSSKAAESFKQKCEALFKEADKDGNGLSIQELASLIRKVSLVDITDEEIIKIFLDLDDNCDRIISWEEFSDVFNKKDPKKIQESELKAAFMEMDTDGSGKLTKAEIKAQFVKLGIKVSDDRLDQILAEADVDRDGSINYSEFLSAWAKE